MSDADVIFLGQRASKLEIGATPVTVTGVNLNVDSGTYYSAGDDSARVIEATCPWASQEMAISILAAMQGAVYQPYTATDALLNPAAEIGDAVSVGGVYSVLANADMRFQRLYTADVSAPDVDEVDDEYPYTSLERRQYDRELARTRSLISKSASEILLQVEGIAEDLEGQISSLSVKLDSITLSVSNGATSSTIELKAGDVTISSETISMSGLVTYSGLSGGTTTIDGACIKTGTIDADRLNLTGQITFSDLNSSTQNTINNASSNASSALSTANSAYNLASDVDDVVAGWTYPGTTLIDGSSIRTGTVEASILRGGTVDLLASNGSSVGDITITSTATGIGLEFTTNRGGMRMTSAGNWWVDASTGSLGITAGRFAIDANTSPLADSSYTCGQAGFRWTDIYATNSTIVTSDLNYKTDVEYGLDQYSALFDALRPVTFKFIDGESGRKHMGLIAQDVEALLVEQGISTEDFAAFIKTPLQDARSGETVYRYAIRYSEFVPLLIYELQQLKAELKDKGVVS